MLIWLVGCFCLCVLACFLAPWGIFWCCSGTLKGLFSLCNTLGDLGAPLWYLRPPVCYSWGTLCRLFGAFGHLGGAFWHPWAPFGCTFFTLGPGLGPLGSLLSKRPETGTQSNRKWEPKCLPKSSRQGFCCALLRFFFRERFRSVPKRVFRGNR